MQEKTVFLPSDSPVYEPHREKIEALASEAVQELDLVSEQTRDQVMYNGIVCTRGKDDRRPSFHSVFGKIARDVSRTETSPNEDAWTKRVRAWVSNVLAVKCSIDEHKEFSTATDVSTGRIDSYLDYIDAIEEHCRTHGMPSLLPVLVSPAKLFDRLRQPAYKIDGQEGREELLTKIATYFCRQDEILQVATKLLSWAGKSHAVIDALETAAAIRGIDLQTFLRDRPSLAANYIYALFQQDRHMDLVCWCDLLGTACVLQKPLTVEKYLRSLSQLGRPEDAYQFLQTNGLPSSDGVRHAVSTTAEQIGWWLYGLGRHDEGIGFLERHVGDSLRARKWPYLNTVYDALLAQRDAPTKEKKAV